MVFKKILKRTLLIVLVFVLIAGGYLFVGSAKPAPSITWGVAFSQKHSQDMGLDWQKNYLALLDDLSVKHIRIASHWDLLEPRKDHFFFEDLDWQIEEAEKRGVKIVLIIGMKTSRWPECHIPNWAKVLGEEQIKERVLKLVEETVSHYQQSQAITLWQVENEPFFSFGECPIEFDEDFVKRETAIVKSLDNRPVLITESGEFPFWIKAARTGDLVGTTMYRIVWMKGLGIYIRYPFPPVFYNRKAKIIKVLFDKKVICSELQAEPWGPSLLYNLPIEEHEKTMNLEQFKDNIEYAKKTGLDQFYLWGSEWWYWMKEVQNDDQIWEEAKKLFDHNN